MLLPLAASANGEERTCIATALRVLAAEMGKEDKREKEQKTKTEGGHVRLFPDEDDIELFPTKDMILIHYILIRLK